MATEIYLGNPPPHIIDWIKAHSKPVASPKTKITFADGSVEEYDWSGEISRQTMIGAGIFDQDAYIWLKEPRSVEIGTGVTSIGEFAFETCTSMIDLIIHNGVISIGNYAFSGCGFTSVMIPDSVTSIESWAFSNCSGLMSVTIPSSVTSIGEWAFYGCSGLTSVTFSGKDKATVQGMANYSWDIKSGCVIHCTDGDITI